MPETHDTIAADGRLRDGFGRGIDYLRVSVADRCDYRCVFCMPKWTERDGANAGRLDSAETLRLCRILAGLGVRAVKITGGEPFLNPETPDIAARLKTDCGVRAVTVTTNGATLDRHAEALLRAGVDCVNVSLNAASPAAYAAVAGVDAAERVKDNILLARRLGLVIKLNMVPIAGVNEDEILPVLDFAAGHGLTIRFIELMPMGAGGGYRAVPPVRIREMIENRLGPLVPDPASAGNGPATYFRAGDGSVTIGFIAALSDNFCAACNRLRLTHGGFLKTCLHSGDGADLLEPIRRGADDDAIASIIRSAVAAKPAGHSLESRPATAGGGEPMYRIGG